MGLFSRKKYTKIVSKSSGLDKLRLDIRSDFSTYLFGLKKDNGKSRWSELSLYFPLVFLSLTDVFYGTLLDSYSATPGVDTDSFNGLADEVDDFGEIRKVISSRLFGISFSIFISKIAEDTGKKTSSTKVIKYLDKYISDNVQKKGIHETVKAYFIFKDDELSGLHTNGYQASTSHELAVMAHGFLGENLGKNDFGDSLLTRSMYLAIIAANKKVSYNDILVEDAQKEGLIK